MTSCPTLTARALALTASLVAGTATASAQQFEVTPFGGYGFGGEAFELLTRQPLDLGGGPTVGVAVDVPTRNGFQVEAVFTHQNADVSVPAFSLGPPFRLQMIVQHYQAGGLQEFETYATRRMRPFLTGTLGLTRFATGGNNEVRFGVAAGGGAKLFPTDHIGLRLNSQVVATFMDAEGSHFVCSGGCIIAIHANVLWQIEFNAGLNFRFR